MLFWIKGLRRSFTTVEIDDERTARALRILKKGVLAIDDKTKKISFYPRKHIKINFDK